MEHFKASIDIINHALQCALIFWGPLLQVISHLSPRCPLTSQLLLSGKGMKWPRKKKEEVFVKSSKQKIK